MFSKKPETVLAERKGRHFPGGARHSPGCSEICFDLAVNSLMFDVLMIRKKDMIVLEMGAMQGSFGEEHSSFSKLATAAKRQILKQKMIFPKLLFPRTFLAAVTW